MLPNPLVIKAGGDGASPLAALVKPFGPADWAAYQANPGLLWIVIGALAVAGIDAARHRSWRRPSVLLAALVAASVVLHQHFAFSSAFWVYRYDAYLLVFALFATAVWLAGLERAGAAPARWRSLAAVAAVGALVLSFTSLRAAFVPEAEVQAASLTAREHQQLARFVATHYPGDTIVVNDIGVMAYRSLGHPLDMFGLCDIEPVLARRKPGGYTKADVRDWAAREHARIAILQLTWGWVPPMIPAEWRKAAELRVLPEGRLIAFYAVDPAISLVDLKGDVGEYFGPLAEANGYDVRIY
jgi:hypothetical protein